MGTVISIVFKISSLTLRNTSYLIPDSNMMLIKAILAITGLTLASGSFAPKIAGKITPSELKFSFQMKDKFDGVNPKHRVKRESQGYNSGVTYIGTCFHYCVDDITCGTQYISADGT